MAADEDLLKRRWSFPENARGAPAGRRAIIVRQKFALKPTSRM
jgi:hypothetical protein